MIRPTFSAHLLGRFRASSNGRLELRGVQITSAPASGITRVGFDTDWGEFTLATSEVSFDDAYIQLLKTVFTYPTHAWARPWLMNEWMQPRVQHIVLASGNPR